VRGRNADLAIAKRVLNWKVKVPLEEGLAKTYWWIEKEISRENV
jgi:nucleoside-diphosphate-sugar epimerase